MVLALQIYITHNLKGVSLQTHNHRPYGLLHNFKALKLHIHTQHLK